MSTTLRTSKLIDLCTPSISYDRQVQSACESFDHQMWEIADDMNGVNAPIVGDQPEPTPPQGIVMIPNIMGITDEKLVDILAWQFHVDFYDATRDLEFRKRLVQMSIIWHKTKGTVALVQYVLDTYWPGGATLSEWFEYMSPLPPPAPNPVPGGVPAPWHDRYRFRVYIDENIIDPQDEQEVLKLIDHYKPISRWCEGIFRSYNAECQIGWCGMLLRFVIRESDKPDEHRRAEEYQLQAPADTSGAVDMHSDLFTVALPTLTAVSAVVTVTPSDGEGGTFTPASAKLSNLNPVAKFAYMPASAGTKTITVTNDAGLADPPAVTYTAKLVAENYSLSGPAGGYGGVASTAFTVALPAGTIVTDVVTITPSDNGAGGTFTPASVTLYATLRQRLEKSSKMTDTASFTYTPPP
jgi:P2-related tail formation protein